MTEPARSASQWLVTRTVQCPSCSTDATLSYALADGAADLDHFVFLCPNLCRLPQDEIGTLLAPEA